MRASRLVSVLLLLQARGRLTAAELAAELEVSERTIHRDVEALSASGIPIYADRGAHGGIRLVDGYRTRLTGMTGEEAEALFLAGLPGPAAELGLGTVVAAAQLKVLASLPTELRARASRLVERFHLDAGDWFRASQPVPHLGALSDAVWNATRIAIQYDRGEGPARRLLEPLGLVLKAGTWYVVAAVDGQVRTYRVSRVVSVEPGTDRFERPEGFDLATYWTDSAAAFERDAPRIDVEVRVRPGSARPVANRRRQRGGRRRRDAAPSPIPRTGYAFGCAWTGRMKLRACCSPPVDGSRSSPRPRSAPGSPRPPERSPSATRLDPPETRSDISARWRSNMWVW